MLQTSPNGRESKTWSFGDPDMKDVPGWFEHYAKFDFSLGEEEQEGVYIDPKHQREVDQQNADAEIDARINGEL